MSRRPNVLIIYPDQLRYDALGCSGNPLVRTPNIDRLAGEGVRFDHAYVSFPLCCPFRASLMTGKYAHSNGMFANHYPIPPDQEFLAEIFRDHGYATAYFGKWHLDGGKKHDFVEPRNRLGFDHFVGFNRGHANIGGIFYRNEDRRPRTSPRYEPEYQTDHLIEFLDQHIANDRERPFMAMIAYGPPHPPLEAPQHYLQMYEPSDVPLSPRVPPDSQLQLRSRQFLARYYGLVTSIDDVVGRVMRWLEERQLAEDTIIVFLSDHGEMAGDHGRFHKKCYYDGAMHVPLIVRYPRGFGPGVSAQLADVAVDLMPTLLELCALHTPAAVQGVSLAPTLRDPAQPVREAVHYEILMEREGPEAHPVPERGIRTRQWLYVRTPQKPIALFDLAGDPHELNNLVDSPQQQAIREQFDARIAGHMERTGDRWELEAVYPPPGSITHEQGAQMLADLRARAIVEP